MPNVAPRGYGFIEGSDDTRRGDRRRHRRGGGRRLERAALLARHRKYLFMIIGRRCPGCPGGAPAVVPRRGAGIKSDAARAACRLAERGAAERRAAGTCRGRDPSRDRPGRRYLQLSCAKWIASPPEQIRADSCRKARRGRAGGDPIGHGAGRGRGGGGKGDRVQLPGGAGRAFGADLGFGGGANQTTGGSLYTVKPLSWNPRKI